MIYTITLNPAIDRLIYLTEELEKRKTNRSSTVRYDVGGKGTHGSYAMSRLGVENLALGFAGAENYEKFSAVLEAKAIPHQFVPVENCDTRESIVVIEPNNQGSTMVTEPSLIVTEKDKQALKDFVQRNVQAEDLVLIAGSLPQEYTLTDLKELIQLIQGKGCFLACDLADEALHLAIEQKVDFIKPNESEIQCLLEEGEELEAKLAELAEKITCIVASRGEKGSICYYQGDQYQVIAPKVEEVNDTGAGDCFVGSFLAHFYQTKQIEHALKMASACAASKVKYEDSTYFDPLEARVLAEQVEVKKYAGVLV